MQNSKKTFVATLAILLLAATLAGCNSQETSRQTPNNSEQNERGMDRGNLPEDFEMPDRENSAGDFGPGPGGMELSEEEQAELETLRETGDFEAMREFMERDDEENDEEETVE